MSVQSSQPLKYEKHVGVWHLALTIVLQLGNIRVLVGIKNVVGNHGHPVFTVDLWRHKTLHLVTRQDHAIASPEFQRAMQEWLLELDFLRRFPDAKDAFEAWQRTTTP